MCFFIIEIFHPIFFFLASSSGKKKTATVKSQPSSSLPRQQPTESKPPAEEPFRNDQYNCPEYYQHDRFSYFELIERMANKRLPQKTNKEMY
ncbi:hypothetical protein BLA29_014478 [Euroglyphus maynei]|uniref:Uncharacterized protein n=1 Tax=Euroglyphus maynei TaxID=6958 RepID=A0A1Y3B737_EURMA|nr:hypothetical protein BLA29_014478 [Euroglyphus maynei]